MREKIERISKGEIEYELPKLVLSEDKIALEVESGKCIRNCLHIKNDKGRIMKGVFYSSNRLLVLESNSFCSTEYTLYYEIYGNNIKAGDIIEGDITIVSDCGEVTIPYRIDIQAPYCSTPIGTVTKIDELTNLARMDWAEAKKVFRSEDFEQVILHKEPQSWNLYRHLLKNISTSQALEEFLILMDQKKRIELTIDRTNLVYEITDSCMDKLVLNKNQWGYCEIRVSTDVEFVQLEQKYLWADRFIGNTHQVSYIIHPDKLGPGNNFGRIYIKTVYQTIVVEILCKRNRLNEEAYSKNKILRQIKYEITQNYMAFRTEHITIQQYIELMEKVLQKFKEIDSSIEGNLFRIHLALVSGQMEVASLLLENIGDEMGRLKQRSPILYSTYLYLEALCHKEDEKVKESTDHLRTYYKQTHDWRILWFLLLTDSKYVRNRVLRITDIKEQYQAGCRSPVLYIEALTVYNEEPYLLRELGLFEMQIIHFGLKYKILSEEMILQYGYLAGKMKNFSWLLYEDLAFLYQSFGHVEILAALCCNLIRGMKKSSNFHIWYRLGVERQLHITELYEYFMYSMEDNLLEPLPEPVLLYFLYNSSLNDRKRAYLYANVITHKGSIPSIYRNYFKRMEVFALKQLEAGNINNHLAILYREFIDQSSVSHQMGDYLPQIMFVHEIICENSNMVAVSIFYRELGEEVTIQINDGRAYLEIYSEEMDIFLLDAYGNRYSTTVEYQLCPLLPMETEECFSMNYRNFPMLLLHLYDYCRKNHVMNEDTMNLRSQYLLVPKLEEKYFNLCLVEMIYYYAQNQNEGYVNQLLSQINLSLLGDSDRVMVLEYYIRSKNHKMIEKMMKEYGWDKIDVKRLSDMCLTWIEKQGVEYCNSLLLSLCHFVFVQGQYDGTILYYLNCHYFGPTESMILLWEATKKHQMDGHLIAERIIYQILFTEAKGKKGREIFEYYYQFIEMGILVKAFLTYAGYQYLMRDEKITESLIHIMLKELETEENDMFLLSVIRFYGKQTNLPDDLKLRISMGIHRLVRKDIVLPFFKEYEKEIDLPECIKHQYYIIHKTDPMKQVYIHYQLVQESENYMIERMIPIYQGIHMKSVMLFYGEYLNYYITEEVEGKVIARVEGRIESTLEDTTANSKYNQINLMRLARENNDEETLLDLMEQFIRTDNIISQCFRPLL